MAWSNLFSICLYIRKLRASEEQAILLMRMFDSKKEDIAKEHTFVFQALLNRHCKDKIS